MFLKQANKNLESDDEVSNTTHDMLPQSHSTNSATSITLVHLVNFMQKYHTAVNFACLSHKLNELYFFLKPSFIFLIFFQKYPSAFIF